MKGIAKHLVICFFAVVVLALAAGGTTVNAAEGRQVVNINKDWKFYSCKNGKVSDAQNTSFNDSKWENIDLPHTWNAKDGQDGGGDYYKGDGWYRKSIAWDSAFDGKRIYIEFKAANKQADVYINGEKLGTHKGGYTAFRYDITDKMNKGKSNLIAVKVNNAVVQDIAPLEADFTFFGGIYRDVSLILTEDVHVNTLDYASSGLKLTTSNVSKNSAKLNIKSTIKNDSGSEQKVTVKAVLKHPDSFEEVEGITPIFNVKDMYGGGDVEEVTQNITIPKGKSVDFSKDITVSNPHLWNGMKDPYRYQVDLTITQNGKVIDSLTEYVGFRWFKVDRQKGFYLNGESYPLRGVCRHQDKEDKGTALSKEDHDADFAMIYEIGANTIRLAHYPHDPYVYEICDKYGFVIWAEIPFVNLVGGSGSYEKPNDDRKQFFEVTRQQLIEMIRQNYNNPSICFWGLQNEVRVTKDKTNDDNVMRKFMKELSDLAHKEDPTGRLTTQATDKDQANNWESDILAWNRYPGWYYNGELGSTFDDLYKKDDRPLGISEYGIGSAIDKHTEDTPKKDLGTNQTEEYQNVRNEKYIAEINEREYLWGTYYWNMFDFSSDGRSEGGLKGVNTKGLITRDRKTKKDCFYLYKANWNTWEPFVYITSRRDTDREKAKTQIKIYSNCDSVTLTVNGKEIGTLKQSDLAQKTVFIWKDVELTRKNNVISVVGTKDGKTCTDKVEWIREAGEDINIQSQKLRINAKTKTIQLNEKVDAADITKVITSDVNAYPAVYEEKNGELVLKTFGEIESGMVLRVISEDRSVSEYFTFVPSSLAYKKSVTAKSEENKDGAVNIASNAVDGNDTTRWAAKDGSFPQTFTIDLGSKKTVKRVETTWFTGGNGKRSYKYKIQISDQKDSGFSTIKDAANNSTVGFIQDIVNGSGRYLRIEVTGASESGNASIYEVDVFGTDYPSTNVNLSKYEAETAKIGGNCTTSDASTVSGGKYVGSIGKGADNTVTFTVNSKTAGKRRVEIRYITGEERRFEVTVNGGTAQKVTCPSTGDWNKTVKSVSIEADLKEGSNTIVIGNNSEYAPNLDCIIIQPEDPEFPKSEEELLDLPREGMVMHRMEGEGGVLENGATLNSDTQEHVSGLGGENGGTAAFTIIGEKEGTRKLRIYYCYQFDGSKLRVTVNGKQQDIDCPATWAFQGVGEEPLRMDISLKEGENSLVFSGVDMEPTPYIDYFNVELTESEQTKTKEYKPSEEKPSDGDTLREALTKAIKEAEACKKEDYTEDTWEVFEKALKQAEAASEDAADEELNALLTALTDAQKALKKTDKNPENGETPPDNIVPSEAKQKLDEALRVAEGVIAFGQADYTDDSWQTFIKAFNNAANVLSDATDEELDALREELESAQKALAKKGQQPDSGNEGNNGDTTLPDSGNAENNGAVPPDSGNAGNNGDAPSDSGNTGNAGNTTPPGTAGQGNTDIVLTDAEKQIVSAFRVTPEVAKEISKAAETYNIPEETLYITEDYICSMDENEDADGSSFVAIQAKSSKQTKTSVKLTWNKVKGADGYHIYGSKCDGGKYKLLKSTKSTSYTQKKLKKGTFYKYIVVAYRNVKGTKVTLAASKTIYAVTKGGKSGVAKSLIVKPSSVSLKAGKTKKITVKEVKADKKIRNQRKVCYESSNASVASVNAKGKITAKKKGKCTIYVYAQNGVYKKIRVVVK